MLPGEGVMMVAKTEKKKEGLGSTRSARKKNEKREVRKKEDRSSHLPGQRVGGGGWGVRDDDARKGLRARREAEELREEDGGEVCGGDGGDFEGRGGDGDECL